jgi:hypothetical protein
MSFESQLWYPDRLLRLQRVCRSRHLLLGSSPQEGKGEEGLRGEEGCLERHLCQKGLDRDLPIDRLLDRDELLDFPTHLYLINRASCLSCACTTIPLPLLSLKACAY